MTDGGGPLPHPPKPPDLILASTSPYRRTLLERLGISFRCQSPTCDESALKNESFDPRFLAERLAHAKAACVAAIQPGAAVIGGDQVVSFQNRIFGKPGMYQRAVDQLLAMAGQSHQLITALVVVCDQKVQHHTDVTTLWMRSLSREAIERYVAADRPFDCAGSYKLESRGIALFERIESADHTAITGIPLIALVTMLRSLGYEVP
jgi:septum formation protein